MATKLIVIVALFFGACGAKRPCSELSWSECEAASHCHGTHEESDDPNHPGFACDPLPE